MRLVRIHQGLVPGARPQTLLQLPNATRGVPSCAANTQTPPRPRSPSAALAPGLSGSPDGAGRGGDGADQAPEIRLRNVDPQRGDLGVERPQRRGGGLLLGVERGELDLDGRAGEAEGAPAEGGSGVSSERARGAEKAPPRREPARPPALSLHSLGSEPTGTSGADFTAPGEGTGDRNSPTTQDAMSISSGAHRQSCSVHCPPAGSPPGEHRLGGWAAWGGAFTD